MSLGRPNRCATLTQDVDDIVDILKKNKVKKFSLADNRLKDENAIKIAEAVMENTSLTWFALTHNQLTNKAMEAFEPVIRKKENITALFLFGNPLVTENMSDKLWEANAAREKPMAENLYGLQLCHHSPARREREAAAKAASKKK